MIITKKIGLFLIIGIILRIIIAATAFHPDVKIVDYTQAVILKEHDVNPYQFYSSLSPNDPRKAIYQNVIADHLPLQYWIRIPIEAVTRIFINNKVEDQFLLDTTKLYGTGQLLIHLLTIKFSLILFDILTAFALLLIVDNDQKEKVFILWMFNPMTLWATEAIGQTDILPTLFVAVSLIFLSRKKMNLSALSLGVAAALKNYPFLLAPYFIFWEKDWKKRFQMILLIVLPTLVSIAPYLSSPQFRANALFAPQNGKILYSSLALSGGESVYVTIFSVIILYYLFFSYKKTFKNTLIFCLSTLLVVLAFTHFHIQWFLWVTPFLIILQPLITKEEERLSLIAIITALIFMLFLFEASLQIRLFSPIFPSLQNAKGLAEILSEDRLRTIKDLSASVFAASSLFLIFSLLKKHDD